MNRIKLSDHQLFAAITLALGLITLALYWPLWYHDFINADDTAYITENPHVNSGLSRANVQWAFITTEQANWHPLTWMSHMLDCQWFGLQPGAHHMVNVLFHIANTLLLFLLLKDATGAFWRSAIVAALFAWHPMHVESVAWAAERKDVLSTLFWLLSLIAYVQYARAPKLPAYLLSLLFFLAGLMSKPMVVTLPFVLLLLDWWPLNRVTRRNLARLLLEKIPFFALTIASSLITYFAQKGGGAVWHMSWLTKMGTIAAAYISYVSKLICPTGLAFPYSQHGQAPLPLTIVVGLLLVLWSCLALIKARENPYFIVGWLYFLGTLVPTIGFIKVGSQTMADRYSYIPSIGLFIIVVWGVYDLVRRRPNQKFVGIVGGTAALTLCLILCRAQIGHWHNSLTLYWHTLSVTQDNYLADDWMGEAYREAGMPKQALYLFNEAVRVEPRYVPAQKDLAVQLMTAGNASEAYLHMQAAASLDPTDSGAQQNLGVYLTSHQQMTNGIAHFEEALRLEPYSVPFMNQLAWIYAACSDTRFRNGRRALQLARQACDLTQNSNPAYLRTLAMAYAQNGDFASAALSLEKARTIAQAFKQSDFLADLPQYEKAIASKQSYSDPNLP